MTQFYSFFSAKRLQSIASKLYLIAGILTVTSLPAAAQQCSPISTLSCPAVVKSLPYVINFSGSEGGLTDKSAIATGFTMVDRPSTPLVTPTFPNTPGYEPSRLEVTGGKLIITTTAGISYLNPAQSAKTNSQVNALGAGFIAPAKFTIQTTLVQPNAGSGKSEQAGLWFGLDEDNYIKLVVQSAGGGASKIEMRKEVSAASTSADVKTTASMTVSSSIVRLKFLIDKLAGSAEGFYSLNGGAEVSVGTLSIPQSFTTGKTLSDGVTQNITFAGVFATHRSATVPITFSFEDFKVEPVVVQGQSNALLFIENLDKFPSNDHFVTSKIQNLWRRDNGPYNANHDSAKIRIHNKGLNTLIINNLTLSNTSTWRFLTLKGVPYDASALPLSIPSGMSADLILQFKATNQGTRVAVLNETLTINSNDDKAPVKTLFLHGLWQLKGEGSNEPFAQEVINAFGFKTMTGFVSTDPDKGNPLTPKGDEVIPSYFVRADNAKPVLIRQMDAYHTCCNSGETIQWFAKGSSTPTDIFRHIGLDGQSLLPRKGPNNTLGEGTISPSTPFGFKIRNDWTDANKNTGGKIGFRVWKAKDMTDNIIPNSYIISNDYLGTTGTNYDYNDNMFYITNVKPEIGSVHYSALSTTPSAVDFEEKVLQTTNTLPLTLKSLGQTYANGSADPALIISSIQITGENKAEFSASMPVKTTLNPQETTTLTVTFTPQTQGLKIADLLIHYNNSLTPHRVPLYGIAKASGTTVTAHYRINSGSSNPITINGKTWSADNQYSFDNLEPYSNSALSQIAGTDEDALYLREQSSNGDKKPFRYEIPVPLNGQPVPPNGQYFVRLHFAEIVWGAPGNGLTGGAGSRVMSVSLENQLRLINLDVAQEVGAATALVKNIPVTVTDGKLNINFSATVNRPMVNAIEVYSFSSPINAPGNIVSEDTVAPISKNSFERIKVYPNPLRSTFNIKFPDDYKGITSIQIADVFGKLYPVTTNKVKLKGQNMNVDISNLSLKTGMYFLKINSDTKKSEVIKLIVQ